MHLCSVANNCDNDAVIPPSVDLHNRFPKAHFRGAVTGDTEGRRGGYGGWSKEFDILADLDNNVIRFVTPARSSSDLWEGNPRHQPSSDFVREPLDATREAFGRNIHVIVGDNQT